MPGQQTVQVNNYIYQLVREEKIPGSDLQGYVYKYTARISTDPLTQGLRQVEQIIVASNGMFKTYI